MTKSSMDFRLIAFFKSIQFELSDLINILEELNEDFFQITI